MSSDSDSDWFEPPRAAPRVPVVLMAPVAPVAPALTLGPQAQTRLLEMVGVAPDVTASSSDLARHLYHQLGVINYTTEFGIDEDLQLRIDGVVHGYFKSKGGLAAAMAARDKIVANDPAKQRDVVRWRIQKAIFKHGKLADVVKWCKAFDSGAFASVSMDDKGKPKTTARGVSWHDQSKQWKVQVIVDGTKTCDGFYVWEFAAAVAKRDECVAAKVAALERKHHGMLSTDAFAGVPNWSGPIKDMPSGTKFWLCGGHTKDDTPSLVVRSGAKSSPACHHPGCVQCAQQNGGDTTLCITHGGGQRCLGPEDGIDCPLGIAAGTHGRQFETYGLHCVRCFCHRFPNTDAAKNAKKWANAKEHAVMAFVEEVFPEYKWTLNKAYGRLRATGHRITHARPDGRTAAGARVLILEIDEHSHKAYLCSKERAREASFVEEAGKKKTVVIIRFNPDEYTDYAGKKHPSCFRMSGKENTVTVNPKQKKQYEKRLAELRNTIETVLDPDFELPPKQEERPALTVELFYDDVAGTSDDARIRKAVERGKAARKAKAVKAEAMAAGASAKRKRGEEEDVCEACA